jgi:hypothetical protein
LAADAACLAALTAAAFAAFFYFGVEFDYAFIIL